MSIPKLIMFDFDGTICDTLDLFYNSFTGSCKELGITRYSSMDSFLTLFDDNLYKNLAFDGISKRTIDKIQALLKEKLNGQLNSCSIFAGLKDELFKLKEDGNILYIITSSISSVVEEYLNKNKFDIFCEVLGADKGQSKVGKISNTIKKNPKYKPYYVGDTVGDIIEGKQANCITVGAAWGWHGEDKLISANADMVSLKTVNFNNDITNI